MITIFIIRRTLIMMLAIIIIILIIIIQIIIIIIIIINDCTFYSMRWLVQPTQQWWFSQSEPVTWRERAGIHWRQTLTLFMNTKHGRFRLAQTVCCLINWCSYILHTWHLLYMKTFYGCVSFIFHNILLYPHVFFHILYFFVIKRTYLMTYWFTQDTCMCE